MESFLVELFLAALIVFNIYRIMKRGSVLTHGKMSKEHSPVAFWGTVMFLIFVLLIMLFLIGANFIYLPCAFVPCG